MAHTDRVDFSVFGREIKAAFEFLPLSQTAASFAAVSPRELQGIMGFDDSHFPPQALEDRGIVELLLTSDNKDGLSKGIINGGTCMEVGQAALRPGCACSPDSLATCGVALRPVLLPSAWRWARSSGPARAPCRRWTCCGRPCS